MVIAEAPAELEQVDLSAERQPVQPLQLDTALNDQPEGWHNG